MRKPLTPTQKARRSVQGKIRRLEKKGEYVPESLKQKVKQARYQTLESFRRNKFSRLTEEIKEAKNDEDWHKRRRESDRNARSGRIPRSEFIVLQNVRSEIDAFPDTKGSQMLSHELSAQIRAYGETTVAQAMENADDNLVEYAHTICAYVETGEKIHDAILSFFTVISGEIMNLNEAKAMGDTMDGMSDMDYES